MRRAWAILVVWLGAAALGLGAEPPKPAVVEVSGYGWLGNRELRRTLNLLQTGPTAPEYYDAGYVEDGVVILLAKLTRDGYLEPRLRVRLTLQDGTVLKQEWGTQLDLFLPRPLAARHVHFIVNKGLMYHYESVTFAGLRSLSTGAARKFFMDTDTLFLLKSGRVYTPARLSQSVANLTEALKQKGFAEAKVTAEILKRNDATGAVAVQINVAEGPRTSVRHVLVEVFEGGTTQPVVTAERTIDAPYSSVWEQNFAQELRTNEYHRGFPDATVQITPRHRAADAAGVQLDLLAKVQRGPHIILGPVTFEGHQRTLPSVMRRRVGLKPGTELDRIEVERAREKLAGLGAFDAVAVEYEPVDEQTRAVVFKVREGRTLNISLLFGFGSYELLRGGVEVDQYNLFGRGHTARLRLLQSFKSSAGEYRYTLPSLLGEDLDVFLEARGLLREEISFQREEYEASIGVQRHVHRIDSDVSARYNYQYLNANQAEGNLPAGVASALVGALQFDFKHDARDNPLVPRRGYNVLASAEFAATELGGDAAYQRLELAAAYHLTLGGGRYLHFGIRHGGILNSASQLPFNKRFFPGGESSVRGYRHGEAAPRDAQGKIIGAETYLQGNLELEQAITPVWSVVAFADAVGFAEAIADYPFTETLYSVGAGVRCQTVVGPVRLEYGYNPKRRPKDPRGTLQISIGFPF